MPPKAHKNVCGDCRGTSFTLIDGFYYCERCRALCRDYLEQEMEDFDNIGFAKSRIRVKREGAHQALDESHFEHLQSDDPRAEKEIKIRPLQERDRLPQAGTDYPQYMARIGRRLAVFARAMSRYADILHTEFNFPPEVKEQCLFICQSYLALSGVAFCEEETTDEPDRQFFRVVHRDKKEVAAMEKHETELRIRRREEKMNKSAEIWRMLTQDESLSESEDETRLESLRDSAAVMKIETKLGKCAVDKAGRVHLEAEVLLAIIYWSCASLGCTTITLSDVARWCREGRFPLSHAQRVALKKAALDDVGRDERALEEITTWDRPVSELMRFTLMLQQVIPSAPALEADLEQILARFVYHLNLPREFLSRVLVLSSLVKPLTGFDKDSLMKQGNVDKTKPFGLRTGEYNRAKFGPERGQAEHEVNTWDTFVAVETKAMALILFALKLSFGLDDRREFQMQEEGKFDVMEWMLQLKLRILVWQGFPLTRVLGKWEIDPWAVLEKSWHSTDEPKTILSARDRNVSTTKGRSKWLMGFEGAIPARSSLEVNYADEVPFADSTRRTYARTDHDAIWAPLRLHTRLVKERLSEINEEEKRKLDEANVKCFLKSHEDAEMPTKGAKKLSRKKFKNGEKKRVEEPSETEEGEKRWKKLFPCAKGYIRLPRPAFTRSSCVGFAKGRARSGLNEVAIYLAREDTALLWKAAAPFFSESLKELFRLLALTIGETQGVLYAALVLLEFRFFESKSIRQINENLQTKGSVPLEVGFSNKKFDERRLVQFLTSKKALGQGFEEEFFMSSVVWEERMTRVELNENEKVSGLEIHEVLGEDEQMEVEEEEAFSSRRRQSFSSSSETSDSGPEDRNEPNTNRKKKLHRRAVHADFDTIWRLLAMRYW